MTIQNLLDHYGESHQNATNKLIHWVCVPAILFSLIGLLYAIPFPFGGGDKTMFSNWAAVFLAGALVYYLRLSIPMFAGFVVIALAVLWGNNYIAHHFTAAPLWVVSLVIFAVAWVGQFVGHKIEGKKPSFLEDVQYLLIGPAWLLHFIYRKVGISY